MKEGGNSMQRLENGGIRIEYKDFDNNVYLFRDIMPELLKSCILESEIWIDEVKNGSSKLPLSKNKVNEFLQCKYSPSSNSCSVLLNSYFIENGRCGDSARYITVNF